MMISEISLARDLGERIEVAQGFQLVAEKFQADGEAAGQGPEVHNAAAQRNVAFLRDLGFRLVTLRLEPFDQIQRVGVIALAQAAGAAFSSSGGSVFSSKAVTLVTTMRLGGRVFPPARRAFPAVR